MKDEDMEFFDPMAGENGFEWRSPEGYPEGVYEMVLYEADDGSHSRFLRLDPGTETEGVLTHEFYEEAYILHGELVDRTLETSFTAGMYARRTPGMEHGPYRSPNGCLTFEVRYYR
jgi:hypothetical protein